MIELNLLDALVKRLTDLLKDYELPSRSGVLQKVKVYAQFLPQPSAVVVNVKTDEEDIEPQGYTLTEIEDYFPCVVVKMGEVTDKEEGSLDQARANVQILIGTYDDAQDCQGYRDVFNLTELIRQDLLTMSSRVLDSRYRLEMPLTSALTQEQNWPFFTGYMNTTWEIARPLMPNYD